MCVCVCVCVCVCTWKDAFKRDYVCVFVCLHTRVPVRKCELSEAGVDGCEGGGGRGTARCELATSTLARCVSVCLCVCVPVCLCVCVPVCLCVCHTQATCAPATTQTPKYDTSNSNGHLVRPTQIYLEHLLIILNIRIF